MHDATVRKCLAEVKTTVCVTICMWSKSVTEKTQTTGEIQDSAGAVRAQLCRRRGRLDERFAGRIGLDASISFASFRVSHHVMLRRFGRGRRILSPRRASPTTQSRVTPAWI